MKKIVSNVFLALFISIPAFGMDRPNFDDLAADDQAANVSPEIQFLLKISDDVTQAAKKVEEASSMETAAKGAVVSGIGSLAFANLSSIWGGIKSVAGYMADTRIARAANWILTAPFDNTIGAAAQKTGLTASVANNDFVKNNSYYMATAGNCAYTAARYALGLATVYAAYRVYGYITTPADQRTVSVKKIEKHMKKRGLSTVRKQSEQPQAAAANGARTSAKNVEPAVSSTKTQRATSARPQTSQEYAVLTLLSLQNKMEQGFLALSQSFEFKALAGNDFLQLHTEHKGRVISINDCVSPKVSSCYEKIRQLISNYDRSNDVVGRNIVKREFNQLLATIIKHKNGSPVAHSSFAIKGGLR